jgi:hypothetical protein
VGTRSSWSPILASLLLLAGCATRSANPWHEVHLPDPHPEVTALASCSGGWVAAGSSGGAPALWTSTDASTWRAVPTRAVSAYGPVQQFSAVACDGDTIVAIGSAAGGAHGNLRTSTWYGTSGGPLVEVPAPFELYGGPRAIGVDRVVVGPRGWLIIGARTDANGLAGAAVWHSTDGRTFDLVDADPALESDARGQTVAFAGYASAGGFTVVGSTGLATRTPLVWTSPDGLHWQRSAVPAPARDAELQRITPDGLAVGLAGTGFGAWYRGRPVGRFGTFAGTGLPAVLDLAGSDALVFTGQRYELWTTTDHGAHWSALSLPRNASSHRIALTQMNGVRLLALDDTLWTG